MPIGYRNGRVDILATLILLTSLVLFIGSLFWLTVNGPWGGGSLFGDDLFKPASYSNQGEESLTTIVEEHEMNLSEAIEDLTDAGCVFTNYTKEHSEDTVQLDYERFKEEAINMKIVFRSENFQDDPVLFVIKKGKTYGWSP